MIIKKRDLTEIINGNGELIGSNAIPTNGSDLESRANNTTDYNAKVGQQPFRYDMMGRFGFTLMPFMEGKEIKSLNVENIGELVHEMFITTIEYYYKNPNKLKSDYRLLISSKSDESSSERERVEDRWSNIMTKLIEPYLEDIGEKIDEAIVVEDRFLDKKREDEITIKSDDKEIKEKKLEKIAGFINKLNKKDIDSLVNLLERK